MDEATESNNLEDWDRIIRDIKDEKCILFVGPDSVMQAPGVSYHQQLINSPGFQNNKQFKYLPREEIFLLTKTFYRGNLVSKFKDYCQQHPYYDETYKKITEIPFHTIIVVTQYPFLIQSFQNNNIAFQHRWFSKSFDKSKPEEEIETPSAETPLVYNLFGRFETDDSLLLTYTDLFDYASVMLNENTIPTKLKDLVKSADEIIFLGFKFEKWYVQLLLRLFKLNDLNAGFERLSIMSGDEADVLNICETDFSMNFIDDNIDTFINALYDKCVKNDLTLRKPAPVIVSTPQDEFTTLLENNLFDEALKKLKDLEVKDNLRDTVTQLTGQWNSIKDNHKDGVISTQDYMLNMNQMRKRIQDAIDDDLEQAK